MESLSGGELPANRLVCLLRFEDGKLPEVYIIPAKAWEKPNDLLKDKDYDGLKSKPAWGINVSRKNLDLLKEYEIETFTTDPNILRKIALRKKEETEMQKKSQKKKRVAVSG